MVDGRAVTHGGKTTEDARVDGVFNPARIHPAIDAAPVNSRPTPSPRTDAAAKAPAAVDARNAALADRRAQPQVHSERVPMR